MRILPLLIFMCAFGCTDGEIVVPKNKDIKSYSAILIGENGKSNMVNPQTGDLLLDSPVDRCIKISSKGDYLLILLFNDTFSVIDESANSLKIPFTDAKMVEPLGKGCVYIEWEEDFGKIYSFPQKKYIIENIKCSLGAKFDDNGFLPVENTDEKAFYIDENGKQVSPQLYDRAYPFQDGAALVSIDYKKGIIDSKFKFIIPPDKYLSGRFKDWFCLLENDKKTFFNYKTSENFTPKFPQEDLTLSWFNGEIGHIYVGTNISYIIDKESKILLEGKAEGFEFNKPHRDGEIYIVDRQKNQGYIFVNSQKILKYENVENMIYDEGYYSILHKDKSLTLVNLNGDEIKLKGQ